MEKFKLFAFFEVYNLFLLLKLKYEGVKMEKVLDVGCGLAKQHGATGVDQVDLPGVDVVCNLNQVWPFAERIFDRVIFRHSICHLSDLEFALREAKRVCRLGGVIEIISPHFSSDNAFTDPTMKFSTGYRTLDYYCSNTSTCYKYYGQIGLVVKYRRIHLYRIELKNYKHLIVSLFFKPIEFLVNSAPRIYEKFFCFILRANEIHYLLETIDD